MDRSSSVRKSLRPRSKPVNYCKLNSGPDLQLEREQPRGSRGKKWSTSKLYELVVTDTKFEEIFWIKLLHAIRYGSCKRDVSQKCFLQIEKRDFRDDVGRGFQAIFNRNYN